MPICRNCSDSFPNRVKIQGKTKSLSNRKFCLACSPFKTHNTRTILNRGSEEYEKSIKKCPRCQEDKTINQFYKRSDGRPSPYCTKCSVLQTTERHQAFKIKCIEYKGSECVKCGYSKCVAAMEFHHRDPTQKDFSISQVKFTKFNDVVKLELDKCDLVCSNCHRELHHTY